MQIQRRRKGFTLVELLVVIAIIAILATVSIIGYTQFIKRANMSADQQAVTQMNTLLEGLDVTNEPDDVVDLWTYLNETGLDAEDYKPLTKDHYFFWDKSINRILLVDKDNKVVFPKAYAAPGKANPSKWNTLSGTIHLEAKPAVADGAVAIAKASDIITIMSDSVADINTMTLSEDVNMMGATHGGKIELSHNITLSGGSSADDAKTLSNLVSTEYASLGKRDEYVNKPYNAGFIAKVKKGAEVTVENLVFEGLVIGSYDTGSSGVLAGQIEAGGKLTVKNVTFRNCTIYGSNRTGIVCGSVGGELVLEKVKIIDCVVNGCEGEAGMIFGSSFVGGSITADEDCSIENTVVNNVDFGLHEIVSIEGENYKYITKVKFYGNNDPNAGEPYTETEVIDTVKHIATTRCATKNTIGWFGTKETHESTTQNNNYYKVGDSLYAARHTIEVTSIAQMNQNVRDWE